MFVYLATCFGLNLIHLQANIVLTKLVKIAKRSHLSGPKVALRLEGDFIIDSKNGKALSCEIVMERQKDTYKKDRKLYEAFSIKLTDPCLNKQVKFEETLFL